MRIAKLLSALTIVLSFAFTMSLIGCGGNAASANHTPPATGSGGNSGSGGSGSGGSGGSGGGASPSVQWSSTMARYLSQGTGSGSGQVTIDTNGMVSIQFSGGTASTSYDAQFCPFPFVAPPNQCFTIGTIKSDANGAGALTVKFPHSGNWSGNFYIHSSADYFDTADANQHGTATMPLIPASGASGGSTSQYPQDPLSSGTVKMANGIVTVSVTGATANASYTVQQYTNATQSSNVATLVTDGSGNGSVTFPTVSLSAPDLSVQRFSNGTPLGAGFLTGFKVP